jgi:dihydrodipicolinate synthase/N-acetylneuraminate lyase
MSDRKLRGSIPPIITPFRNGEVDYECFAALLEHQVDQGSHGVLINGTTAEPSTLTLDERNRLVSAAVEAAAGRLPVVPCADEANSSARSASSRSSRSTIKLTNDSSRLKLIPSRGRRYFSFSFVSMAGVGI